MEHLVNQFVPELIQNRVWKEKSKIVKIKTVNNADKIFNFKINNLNELKNKIKINLNLEEPIGFYHIQNGYRAEIFDFEYLCDLDDNQFITVVGKGQSIRKNLDNRKSTGSNARSRSSSITRSGKSNSGRIKRHVEPPDGELARFTIDFFKQSEDDIGSIKVTTSLTENSAMSYDIHIPGLIFYSIILHLLSTISVSADTENSCEYNSKSHGYSWNYFRK